MTGFSGEAAVEAQKVLKAGFEVLAFVLDGRVAEFVGGSVGHPAFGTTGIGWDATETSLLSGDIEAGGD